VTKALDYAHDAAKAWIEGLDVRPVAARATLGQLRNTFQHALPETGETSHLLSFGMTWSF
jgi:hypothetical protein